MARCEFRIGQTMVLYITCIKSEAQFIKLWVLPQVDLDDFRRIENMLTENAVLLDASSRLIRGQISPGYRCVVKSKLKNRWCRALIHAVLENSFVFVRLLDYGNDESVSLSDVGNIDDNVINHLPDLATECVLADVAPIGTQWAPEVISFCEDHLLLKELNGSVIAFCNDLPTIRIAIMGESQPFVQRLINIGHAQIHDVTRTIATYKSIQLSLNTKHLVSISYVESHVFYVQLVSAETDLMHLMNAIKSWSEVEQPSLVHAPIKGTPCLAKVEHIPCYYRAIIRDVRQGRCQVQFVDYGYSEFKDFRELKAIPSRFLGLPAQAIACTFPKDTSLTKDDFIEVTQNKHLNCHVIENYKGLYRVKLFYGDQDVFLSQKIVVGRRIEPQISLKYRAQKLIPGTEVDITISVLNDLDDFYIQLINQKEHQDLISSLLNSGYEYLTLNLSELLPNMPICVKYSEDKKWYRGEIMKVLSENHIEVFFVDFGNTEVVKLCDARRINSSCLQYPIQAFKCFLANLQSKQVASSKSVLFEVFEELVIGRNLVAKVEEISDESYSVKLYEKNSKVSINDKLQSKDFNIECVPVSSVENLYVTSFQSPESFFAQFEKLDQDMLIKMQEEIDRFYCKDTNLKFNPLIGDYVCAKFTDDSRFYRGKVMACNGDLYKIFFIDYGNQETVHLQDIHPLIAKFMQFPIFGISCGFHAYPPNTPIDNLRSLMLDNSIQANMLRKQNETWLVSLTENPLNVMIIEYMRQHESDSHPLNHGMVSIGLGDSFSNDKCTPKISKLSNIQHVEDFEEMVIPPKAVRNVYVSHVVNPSEFYCQIEEESPKLQFLMESISKVYENLDENSLKLNKFLIGSPCCAKYQEDEKWYRGKIKGTNSRTNPTSCDVFFIDYGNIDVVPTSNVKVLQSNMLHLPPQALKCSSFNLSPSNGTWTDEDINAFYEMFCEKYFIAQFIESNENDLHVVNLVNKGKLENECLSKEFMNLRQGNSSMIKRVTDTAQYQPPLNILTTKNPVKEINAVQHIMPNVNKFLSPSVRMDVFESIEVTWIINQCEFYCQLKSSASDFKSMMINIQNYYNDMPQSKCALGNPCMGMICIAQFSQDLAWYRAEIQNVDKNNISVFYVDYGNLESTTSKAMIRSISQNFSSLPKQGIKCHINGIKNLDNGEFTPQMAQKYFAGDLKCKFISKEKDYFIVDVLCNQTSVAQKMITDGIVMDKTSSSIIDVPLQSIKSSNCEAIHDLSDPCFYPKNKFSFISGQLLSVIVSYVINPSKFWCQLQDDSENLTELMALIESHYSASKSTGVGLKVGNACIAKYSEDCALYRAVIQDCFSPKEYKVMFVDYGNSEVVQSSEVYLISPEFAKLPPQAFQCNLYGIPESISGKDDVIELFQSVVNEAEELTAKVETSSNGLTTVSLFYDKGTEEVNVSDTLLQKFESDVLKSSDCPHFQPPKVLPGLHEGYVSIVLNPLDFYVQLASSESHLADMVALLADKYGQMTIEENRIISPRIGMACCAKYAEDGNWYRAEIISIQENTATVNFVDYGNVEEIDSSSLKSLDESFLSYPSFAFKCKISNIAPKDNMWSEVAITAFEKIVIDTPLNIDFFDNESPFSVSILKDGQDVAQIIIGMELATQAICDADLKMNPNIFKAEAFLQLNLPLSFICIISFVDSFDKFFVTPVSMSSDLDEITEKLQTLYSSALEDEYVLSDPSPLLPCAVKYKEDDAWYRAIITDVQGSDIFITFVDYGNSDIVSLQDVKSLVPDLLQIPPVAVEGSLFGLQPVASKKAELKAKFEDLCLNEINLEVEVYDNENNKIKLITNSDFIKSLVSEGLILLDEKSNKLDFENTAPSFESFPHFDLSPKFLGRVSYVDSTDSFFVIPEELSADLDTITCKLESLYTAANEGDLLLSDPKPSMPCAAKYSDGAWYRAIITALEGDDAVISFVDYGNSEVIPSKHLRALSPELVQMPISAVQCTFGGLRIVDGSEMEVKNQLDELCSNETEIELEVVDAKFKIIKLRSDSDFVSSLLRESFVELLSEECAQTELNSVVGTNDLIVEGNGYLDHVIFAKYPDGKYSSKFLCKVSYVDSFDKFYIFPSNLSVELEKVMCTLKTLCDTAKENDYAISDLKLSMACAAKYNEDESWYRAMITDIRDDDIYVTFVDYGNSEVVTSKDLKLLTDELLQIPPIAIEGSLLGLRPVEGKETEIKEKLEELYVNEVELEVEVCDENPKAIKLVRDSDFVNLLLNDGLVELSDKQFQCLNDSESFKGNLKIAFVDDEEEVKSHVTENENVKKEMEEEGEGTLQEDEARKKSSEEQTACNESGISLVGFMTMQNMSDDEKNKQLSSESQENENEQPSLPTETNESSSANFMEQEINLVPDSQNEEHEGNNLVPDFKSEEQDDNNIVPDSKGEEHDGNNIISDFKSEEQKDNNIVPDSKNEEQKNNNLVPDSKSEEHERNNLAPDFKSEEQEDNIVPDSKSEEQEGNNIVPYSKSEEDEGNDLIPDSKSEEHEGNNLAPDFKSEEQEDNNIVSDSKSEVHERNNLAPDFKSEEQEDNIVPDSKSEEQEGNNIVPYSKSEEDEGNDLITNSKSEEQEGNNIVPDSKSEEDEGNDLIPDSKSEEQEGNNKDSAFQNKEPKENNFVPDSESDMSMKQDPIYGSIKGEEENDFVLQGFEMAGVEKHFECVFQLGDKQSTESKISFQSDETLQLPSDVHERGVTDNSFCEKSAGMVTEHKTKVEQCNEDIYYDCHQLSKSSVYSELQLNEQCNVITHDNKLNDISAETVESDHCLPEENLSVLHDVIVACSVGNGGSETITMSNEHDKDVSSQGTVLKNFNVDNCSVSNDVPHNYECDKELSGATSMNETEAEFDQANLGERHLQGKQKITISEIAPTLDQAVLLAVIPSNCVGELEKLQSTMQNLYSDDSKPVQEISTSNIYAVESKSGIWYRAKILGERGGAITVLYIDSGSSETLDKACARELDMHLKVIPPFAIWCTLAGALCLVSKEEFEKEVNCLLSPDSDVEVVVIGDLEPYKVDLLINQRSILPHLVAKKVVAQSLVKPYVDPGVYEAKISSARMKSDHIELYVNLILQLEDLNKLIISMQNSYKQYDEHINVYGAGCYAVYVNDSWFRCSISNDDLTARLVDTGESVEINADHLYPLLPEHCLDPPYAIPCALPEHKIISDDFVTSVSTLVDPLKILIECDDCRLQATFQDETLNMLTNAGYILHHDS